MTQQEFDAATAAYETNLAAFKAAIIASIVANEPDHGTHLLLFTGNYGPNNIDPAADAFAVGLAERLGIAVKPDPDAIEPNAGDV